MSMNLIPEKGRKINVSGQSGRKKLDRISRAGVNLLRGIVRRTIVELLRKPHLPLVQPIPG
jgi:hypothetical protein